jgi:hypothetical protein
MKRLLTDHLGLTGLARAIAAHRIDQGVKGLLKEIRKPEPVEPSALQLYGLERAVYFHKRAKRK